MGYFPHNKRPDDPEVGIEFGPPEPGQRFIISGNEILKSPGTNSERARRFLEEGKLVVFDPDHLRELAEGMHLSLTKRSKANQPPEQPSSQ